MIGVVSKADQAGVVREFFELFKTPWEIFTPGRSYDAIITTTGEIPEAGAKLRVVCGGGSGSGKSRPGVVVRGGDMALPVYGRMVPVERVTGDAPCVMAGAEIAGLKLRSPDTLTIRLAYDLFEEVRFLLTTGQPVERAATPVLDLHIQMLREWMIEAGISFFEILPAPAGHSFVVCLTHDIDFVGIRRHFCDHSMFGFAYRATVGSLRNFARGHLSFARLFQSWRAVASLPFVFAGWAKDFWEPFPWYLETEQGLPATYFLIPFKRRAGEKVPGRRAAVRATAYDVTDLPEWTAILKQHGNELGVHGIDSWHSAERGREELARLETAAGDSRSTDRGTGIRMHWLLQDEDTPQVLERAGYAYDSTCGYNETVGYRAGTSQVFRPLNARTLLELPMHIQDGALFYPDRLGLNDDQALERCETLVANARRLGGVLTLLWHDRSHAPERFWGECYRALLGKLKQLDVWFASAAQVTSWFRQRREVRFEREGAKVSMQYAGPEIQPPLNVRIYRPEPGRDSTDISWDGKASPELEFPSGLFPTPALSRR